MSKLRVLNLPYAGLRPEAEETIGDHEEIATHLALLLASRTTLGISIEEGREVYLSRTLEILPEAGYLVLDELAPIEGHRRLGVGSRLLVTARSRGTLLRFFSEVQDIGSERGMAYYRLRWPRLIGLQQRRRHFRVFVPLSQRVPLLLATDEDVRLQGELRDLSVSGFSARLPDQLPIRLMAGQVLPSCRLALPDHGQLILPVELRYLEPPRNERRSARIGGRFLRLSTPQERQLEKMVRAIEREAQRRGQRERPRE
jgi:c-di-GMP-binding flagellar brake protein YcgR